MSLQLPGDDEDPPQELLELPEADDDLDLADLMPHLGQGGKRGLDSAQKPKKGGARQNPSRNPPLPVCLDKAKVKWPMDSEDVDDEEAKALKIRAGEDYKQVLQGIALQCLCSRSIECKNFWDLTKPDIQHCLVSDVAPRKPYFLMLGPACTLFGALVFSNWFRMGKEAREERLREAVMLALSPPGFARCKLTAVTTLPWRIRRARSFGRDQMHLGLQDA